MYRAVVVEIDTGVRAPCHIGTNDSRVGHHCHLTHVETVGLAVKYPGSVEVNLHIVKLRWSDLAGYGRAPVDPNHVDIAIVADIDIGTRAPPVAVGQSGVVDQHEVANGPPTAAVILPNVVQRRADVLDVLPGIGVD